MLLAVSVLCPNYARFSKLFHFFLKLFVLQNERKATVSGYVLILVLVWSAESCKLSGSVAIAILQTGTNII